MASILQPLGRGIRFRGMIAIASTGLFSASISLFFILYAFTSVVILHRRKTPQERHSDTVSARRARFFESDFGLLLLNLLVGDFIAAFAFSLNWRWILLDGWPTLSSPTCIAQGALLQYGDMHAASGSLLLALHLFSILVFSYKPKRWVVVSALACTWLFAFLLTIIGPIWIQVPESSFYAFAGAWCWISAGNESTVTGVSGSTGYYSVLQGLQGMVSYEEYRLWMHYLFVFIVAIAQTIIYTVITIKIVRDQGPSSNRNILHHVARIMLLFPLTYLVTILPLAIFRIASLSGKHLSIYLELVAGSIFSSAGFFNVVLYSITRGLVSFSGLTGSQQPSTPSMRTVQEAMSGPMSKDINDARRPSLFSLLSAKDRDNSPPPTSLASRRGSETLSVAQKSPVLSDENKSDFTFV